MKNKDKVMVVIGVGGSGIHSVLAYLHISRLLHEKVVKPFGLEEGGELLILDGDTSGARPETLWKSFETTYQEIDNRFKRDLYLIDPTPSYIAENKASGGQVKFENLMGNFNLLPYLFEKEHLEQDILYGFVGKPPVGATVFQKKIVEDIMAERPSSEIESMFKNKIRDFDRVIFVGSFIGGTGAGVIPALGRYMKKVNPELEIVYVTHGNWFSLDGSSPNAEYNVKQEDIDKNTVGGMEFLVDSIESKVFKTVVVIDFREKIGRKNDGGKDQKEQKVFFYLLAGFLLRNYLKVDKLDEGLFFIQLDNLRENDPNDTLLHRFNIQDTYSNQGEFISFSAPASNNFFECAKKAYKVYFYISYFIKWMDSSGFDSSFNPLPDKSERRIKAEKGKVKKALSEEKNRLHNSLNWLEKQKLPDSIKEFYRTPFKLEDFIKTGDSVEKMFEFMEGKRGVDVNMDVLKVTQRIELSKDKDVPEAVVDAIWKAVK